jgi:hypothetical protein
MVKSEVFSGLRKLNLFAAFFHIVQGILILALANDFSITVTRGFLKFDQVTRSLVPAFENIFDVKLAHIFTSYLLNALYLLFLN